ncbi:hypothetical protein LTR56_006023 [Elasticomyces elasticus]|nr:hypothetical protein LTR56_006023 [Elasticomyces elasticus]KAK3669016.1 hypothetical protein LTR22_000095 [Elasticomyces elasticus]KAK4922685.1 hypothetical protein LTR49_010041 [Elasticomyces elasticus]KAK5705921.1 hypothetical protein LTR17_021253 [Elasticomyces elasticus]KAK5760940.1 hypothetical protein LTS12_008944 [Elasticomyces elasticus]
MPSTAIFLLPLFVLSAAAQCVTSGYELCVVPGSQDAVDTSALDLNDISAASDAQDLMANIGLSANSAAESAVRRALAREVLAKRQDLTALCCLPAPVECMYMDDVAFCYTPETTRSDFPGGSYAFESNGTFYGADGTFIDYKNGVYQYPNGTTESFTPEEDSETETVSDPNSDSIASDASSTSSPGSSSSSPAANSYSQASTRASTTASTSAPATAASIPSSAIGSTVSSGVSTSNAFFGKTLFGAVGVMVLLGSK